MEPISRRGFCALTLSLLAARSCLAEAVRARALPRVRAGAADRWLRRLAELSRDLKDAKLAPEEWQDAIAALWRSVDVAELVRDIDLDRLVRGLTLPADMAAVREVPLALPGLPLRFGHRVFALKRGAAVVPHAHNNMVSAHLVVRGTFHVRTFQRVRDEDGALVLAPSIDRTFGPGEVLTMSDTRDNIHWLVATEETACTFDTPVSGLVPGKRYATAANEWGMIHVDPTARPQRDGTVRAPVITFEEAIRRFGKT